MGKLKCNTSDQWPSKLNGRHAYTPYRQKAGRHTALLMWIWAYADTQETKKREQRPQTERMRLFTTLSPRMALNAFSFSTFFHPITQAQKRRSDTEQSLPVRQPSSGKERHLHHWIRICHFYSVDVHCLDLTYFEQQRIIRRWQSNQKVIICCVSFKESVKRSFVHCHLSAC